MSLSLPDWQAGFIAEGAGMVAIYRGDCSFCGDPCINVPGHDLFIQLHGVSERACETCREKHEKNLDALVGDYPIGRIRPHGGVVAGD